MTTKSQPFSRLSRFGVPFKSNPSSRNRNPGKAAAAAEDDNWYIPYNGPVEAPRRPYAKPKERDSWGDSVYDDGEGIMPNGWDKGRTELGRNGSSDASHRSRQPTRSYVNVDPSGGVGESPAPRISRESAPKSPFASIFSFGSPKKRASPPSVSTKSDSNNRNRRGRRDDRESNGDDEDYYNSYYSSLVQSPLKNQYQSRPEDPRHSPTSPIGRSEDTHSPVSGQSSSSIPHPYAYVFPTSDYNDAPKTAPLMSMTAGTMILFNASQYIRRRAQATASAHLFTLHLLLVID
ncbi:hypothetical protein EDD18DRAFT_350879 [Armillaria luteobubalina]|uniref:Uncharacterized protein n=1 Tax=Armillaria luteobubalina TaxID=153913 RepID=A0AA39Q1W8_9AGAR|nr:hypothetical protein EDD18DRAFT_350879 [Armillaria luteobubalina]